MSGNLRSAVSMRMTLAVAWGGAVVGGGTARADVPPSLPVLGIDVPSDRTLLIAGVFLSLAAASAGYFLARGWGTRSRWIVTLGTTLVVTCGFFLFGKWCAEQRGTYDYRRDQQLVPSVELQQRGAAAEAGGRENGRESGQPVERRGGDLPGSETEALGASPESED